MKKSLFSALVLFDGGGVCYPVLNTVISFNSMQGAKRAFINACNKKQLSGTLSAWYGHGETVTARAFLVEETGAEKLILSATLKTW